MHYGCLFFTGLECQVRQRQVIDHIASVASFIVNRVDTLVDMLLKERTQQADEMQRVSLKAREGKIAATGAKIAYSQFLRDVTHVLAEVLQLAMREEAPPEGSDEERSSVNGRSTARAGGAVLLGTGLILVGAAWELSRRRWQ